MKSNLALSTSLSWDQNWDPKYSINLIKESEIGICQVFVGDNFFKDENLATEIADNCRDSLKLLAHSPVDLNDRALDPQVIKKIKDLLKYNNNLVVYHHDSDFPLDKTLEVVKKLNDMGLIVLLENFYFDKSDVSNTLKLYKEMLKAADMHRLELYPLLDIPRLFISGIVENIDSLKETYKLLEVICSLEMELYLHLIDCKDRSQARDSWCSIGQGVIPYRDILNKIDELGLTVPITVLEYEELKHIDNSIEFLKKI